MVFVVRHHSYNEKKSRHVMSQDVMVHFGRLVTTFRRYMNSRFQIQTVVAQRSESHAMILEGQMFSFALAVSWIEFRKTTKTIEFGDAERVKGCFVLQGIYLLWHVCIDLHMQA